MIEPLAHLLDVNFLIALAWPNHIAHRSARTWFLAHQDRPFATCPITQSGFVRISMNPLVVGEQVALSTALDLLSQYQTRFAHLFWPDAISITTALSQFQLVSGHRQVTDAYLVALAAAHSGSLVTFDRAIAAICPEEFRGNVLVVE